MPVLHGATDFVVIVALPAFAAVARTIVFRGLLLRARGPRNFMKNPPAANKLRIEGEQKTGFSTLRPEMTDDKRRSSVLLSPKIVGAQNTVQCCFSV
jgi:hypothetical protein